MYTTLPPIQLDFSLSQDQITQAQTLVRNFLRKKFFPANNKTVSKTQDISPEEAITLIKETRNEQSPEEYIKEFKQFQSTLHFTSRAQHA